VVTLSSNADHVGIGDALGGDQDAAFADVIDNLDHIYDGLPILDSGQQDARADDIGEAYPRLDHGHDQSAGIWVHTSHGAGPALSTKFTR